MQTISNIDLVKESYDFTGCVPSSKLEDVSSEFLEVLVSFAMFVPFRPRVNSLFRTVSWEKSRGRSGSSSHCKGLAIDISAKTNQERIALLEAAHLCGISRIGIGKTYIHLDIDSSKPSSCWLYD